MELTILNDKVQQTKDLLNAVRGSSITIGMNLYEIKQELPKEMEWRDFIREQFDISESFASKLMTVYKVFVLEGGISPAKLESVDSEKLYLARDLDGDIEEKLEKAKLLTRRELKEEKTDEDGHEHEWIEVCKKCSIRK